MKKKEIFVTNNYKQTQKLGEILAKKLQGGQVICLIGELGSGKTTFAQGVLKGLGIKGPFTSPTFVVIKKYHIKAQFFSSSIPYRRISQSRALESVYHIDCYRVKARDILNLGWEEIIANKKNTVIVEWAERIKTIIPKSAVWIKFQHGDKNKREITIKAKI